jgi:uncharacterized SAM-binding protein YcdF (DUF218 family)
MTGLRCGHSREASLFFSASKLFWFFATPSNLLAFLTLLGFALAVRRGRRRGGLRLGAIGATAMITCGLLPVANWIILPLEQRFPPIRDAEAIAGIVVLGGAVQSDETFARAQLVLNDAAERLTMMADLSRRYPDARVVFSGGAGTLFEDQPAEAAAVERSLAALGIDKSRVEFESRSRSTYENALYTHQLVRPSRSERWLLVTSAFHMPRAIGCFRRAGFSVVAYPVDFRTRGWQDVWRTFSFTSDGLRRMDVAAKEWVGLLGYYFAGYTDALFPGPEPVGSVQGSIS